MVVTQRKPWVLGEGVTRTSMSVVRLVGGEVGRLVAAEMALAKAWVAAAAAAAATESSFGSRFSPELIVGAFMWKNSF